MTDAREIRLRRILDDIAKERQYENYEVNVKGLPPTGANFSSQLFHATISAPNKKDISVFAKVSVMGEQLRAQMSGNLFDIEAHVYTKLGKIYRKLEDDNEVPEEHRLFMPKYYGGSAVFLEEVLVLQDLSAEGFTTYNRLKSIDWEYASTSVEQLAKLHALSIAYQEKYPEDYKEAIKVLRRNLPLDDATIAQMMSQMYEKVMEAVNIEHREKLQQFFMKNMGMDKLLRLYEPLKRPVLVHGDYRMSNLMHKVDENGKLQVVIVDYQTLCQGNPTSDLLYFIFTGSDAEFRRRHFQQLLDHYYEQFSLALVRLNLDPDKIFTRQDFDDELKETMPFGLMIAVMMLPMITVDLENVSQETDSLETLSNMMEKANSLAFERISEVVEDYVQWGLL